MFILVLEPASAAARPGAWRAPGAKSWTWCRHDVPAATSTPSGAEGAGGRQQLTLADGARHVVVRARVAERPGHAAAAGVEVGHGGAGNAAQQRRRRAGESHRRAGGSADGGPPWPGPARSGSAGAAGAQFAFEELLEEHALAGHRLGPLRGCRAAQQRRHVFAHGREAARLEEHDVRRRAPRRRAARPWWRRPTMRASSSSPCEMSGRPQQPCGTSRVPMPARSSTSTAATPISGSLCSVKVSAKSTARTGDAGLPVAQAPRERAAGPGRQRAAAVHAEQRLVHRAAQAARRDRVDERRQAAAERARCCARCRRRARRAARRARPTAPPAPRS